MDKENIVKCSTWKNVMQMHLVIRPLHVFKVSRNHSRSDTDGSENITVIEWRITKVKMVKNQLLLVCAL